MSRNRGRDQAPEPEEEPFDAFAPNPRNSSADGPVTSTGSWEAFPTTFPIPVIKPDDPPPPSLFTPAASRVTEPAARTSPERLERAERPKRFRRAERLERPERSRLVRALRGAGSLVAAAGLVAVTVGVQWWHKSAWVADRYPSAAVTDVRPGQEATMRGVRWKVGVTGGPQAPGQAAGTASLVADVQVTPTSTAEIQRSFPPRFTMRDRAGHVWLAGPEETPIRSELKVGQPVRMKVVAVVPERLRDTAELVLSYSEREMLRFAR